MSKELKKYELRTTTRPAKRPEVSAAVLVVNEQGDKGYCYVSFSDSLVQAIGKKLPRGVAAFDPAHLMVAFDQAKRVWRVLAVYFHDAVNTILWETAEKPSWLKFIGVNDGRHHSQEAGRPGSSPTSPRRSRARPSPDYSGQGSASPRAALA